MIRFLAAPVAALAMAALVTPAAGRPFTQRDLVALDRVSDPRISPDGRWVVYDLSTLNGKGTGREHAVMKLATSGAGAPAMLAKGSAARWAPDGEHVFYIAAAGATDQVWRVSTAHPERPPAQVTDLPADVGSFRLAPDGRTLVVSMAVIPGRESVAAIRQTLADRAARTSSGALYDHLFVRHWDTWSDHTRNHLFALSLAADGRATGEPIALTAGFDGDIPSKPFGDDGDYVITPDSKTLVFSARQAGRTEPWSTNFDLWRVPLAGGAAPHDITADNKAWDAAPAFSPDGRLTAYRAMKRPGFEADRFGVILESDATRTRREIDPQWDRSADQIAFSGDARSLYVEANDAQSVRVFRMDVATGAVTPLTGQGHVGPFDLAHAPDGDMLTFTRDSMSGPPQVYVMKPGSAPVQLTHVGEAALRDVEMAPYESFSFAGWNNETVHGWIVKPSGWRPGVKFPTVFLVHGGPQGSWEDSWSTRWNPEVWAGWGYGVVMVDFHGSTGYGQAFTDAISNHWGDRPLEDLQKGWSAAQIRAPWIDASRACEAGASYGGFMTYWIAGVWSQPWACQIDHDGIFDNRIMGYATDEQWFSEWENGGGPVWANPANYEKFNPINHVAAWTKPMLVIHSEKDYRIPLDQGLAAFTALQSKGVESQFLTFPDENHWVLKPANSLMWHDTIEAWLKRWIGSGPSRTDDAARPRA